MVKRRSNQLSKHEINKVMDTKELLMFEEAKELFLKDCSIRNLREHTLKYYNNELRTFLKLLNQQGLKLNPNEITSTHIKENVIIYMKEELGVKTVTINTRLRAVRTFFNFLHDNKHIKKNPMDSVKLLKDRRRIVETFTRDELRKLLKQPDLHTFTGVRNLTIMLLFLETGIRANELVNIQVSDIQDHSVRIRSSKTYLERLVPIQPNIKTFLFFMQKANPKFHCDMERYMVLRRLYARKTSPFREEADFFAYDNNVRDLLGVFVPIYVI